MQCSLDAAVLGEGPSYDAAVKVGEKCHSCILPSGFSPKVPSAPGGLGLPAVTSQMEQLFTSAHPDGEIVPSLASGRDGDTGLSRPSDGETFLEEFSLPKQTAFSLARRI